MRIVSLLPAATEILYAIGAGDSVFGVTHECDFPPEAARKPKLLGTRLDPAAASAEIDRQVRELIERGESIYVVDAELLASIGPDLIVTQDLCHVCAATPEDLASALSRLPPEHAPRVLAFTPRILADVWAGIREIGEAAGCADRSRALASESARRVDSIERATRDAATRPRTLCLEWFDPPYCGGHWVPEMVRLAGGVDLFGKAGQPSVPIEWERILEAQPEIVVLMPCGYGLARNLEVWKSSRQPAGWNDLPAVRSGRVYAVDGNAYFSRCGPRLADGVVLLAGLLHPEIDFPGREFASQHSRQVLSLGANAI